MAENKEDCQEETELRRGEGRLGYAAAGGGGGVRGDVIEACLGKLGE